jgi:hypothetical protein
MVNRAKGFRSEFAYACRWGLIFCLAQVFLCLLIAPHQGGLEKTYQRLIQWDSYHYIDIVERGYQLPEGTLTAEDVHANRANVGYFPGYPFFSKSAKLLFGTSNPISLLLVAQLFCFIFWTEIFLLMGFWGVPKRERLFCAFTIGVFPSAFFLVAGYSESLFMATLLGLILGTERWIILAGGRKVDSNWVLAAVSGFFLSATRLVGIPLAVYPVIRWVNEQQSYKMDRKWMRVILLSSFSILGGISFFLICQIWFGHWDVYLKLQQLGWGNKPNYLALFLPSSYIPKLFFEDTTTSVCRASNLFVLCLFIGLVWMKRSLKNTGKMHKSYLQMLRNPSNLFGDSRILGLFYAASSMFFISLSGKASYSMDSMVRYNFPVFVILVLMIVKSALPEVQQLLRQRWKRWLLISGYVLAIAVQVWMIRVFCKGGWVA